MQALDYPDLPIEAQDALKHKIVNQQAHLADLRNRTSDPEAFPLEQLETQSIDVIEALEEIEQIETPLRESLQAHLGADDLMEADLLLAEYKDDPDIDLDEAMTTIVEQAQHREQAYTQLHERLEQLDAHLDQVEHQIDPQVALQSEQAAQAEQESLETTEELDISEQAAQAEQEALEEIEERQAEPSEEEVETEETEEAYQPEPQSEAEGDTEEVGEDEENRLRPTPEEEEEPESEEKDDPEEDSPQAQEQRQRSEQAIADASRLVQLIMTNIKHGDGMAAEAYRHWMAALSHQADQAAPDQQSAASSANAGQIHAATDTIDHRNRYRPEDEEPQKKPDSPNEITTSQERLAAFQAAHPDPSAANAPETEGEDEERERLRRMGAIPSPQQ